MQHRLLSMRLICFISIPLRVRVAPKYSHVVRSVASKQVHASNQVQLTHFRSYFNSETFQSHAGL